MGISAASSIISSLSPDAKKEGLIGQICSHVTVLCNE